MPTENFAVPPPFTAVAVVGDVMLDDNLTLAYGEPESELTRRAALTATSANLGGAGNVAANVAGLGLHAALVGMTGDDVTGGRLHGMARVKPGVSQMLFVCREVTTPRKLRLYGRHTLDTRIDDEGPAVAYPTTERARHPFLPTPLDVCRHLAATVKVFCEIDHGKGFLADTGDPDCPAGVLRRYLRATEVPVIADPRPSENWPYLTGGRVILKMNAEQLNAVVGARIGQHWTAPTHAALDHERRTHFEKVRDEIAASRAVHCDYLWLTYGKGGMSLGPLDGGWSAHVPAHLGEAVPVDEIRIDPTGCGDTCTAVMAHQVATRGYTAAAIVDGFIYANHAAGLAARHLGCHVMTKKTFEDVHRGVSASEDRRRVLAAVG